MNLLVLGGTVFVGRHVVSQALERGHTVTLFNRGKHNPELFPEVEKIHADRDGGLAALGGRRWDAVLDPSGYLPRLVRASAEYLQPLVEHYTFISTISVYADPPQVNMDERSPLSRMEDESVEQITGETYGPLKVLCEQATLQVFGERALIIRPGLIVGPYDPSDRFTYWPERLARGGQVLAPGAPERPVQFIDGRDLAGWTLDMIEARQHGIYNATGPASRLTLGELLAVCQAAAKTPSELVWVDDAFLLAQEVAPYSEMPLWLPESHAAMDTTSIQKALDAGLHLRPLAETVADTLAWSQSLPSDRSRRAGISAEREASLLDAWGLSKKSL